MVKFDFYKVFETLPNLIQYVPVTIMVILSTILLGSVLGLGLTYFQLGDHRILKRMAKGYIFVMRCTPAIVLLFLVYYALPDLLSDLGFSINETNPMIYVIIALVLLFAATSSETFRSAYQAVDKAQTEAGLSVGMSGFQTFIRIILPQATVIALPNFCNGVVEILKAGALAYTIGLVDVMGGANLIIGRTYGNYSLETYTAVAIIYWALVIIIEGLFGFITHRLSHKVVKQSRVRELEPSLEVS